MEGKNSQWTLESLTVTLGTESSSTSIAINIDIWQRNTNQRRKNRTCDDALNVTKKDIQPETTKKYKQ